MKCPQCQSEKIRTVSDIDENGDVERIVCANEECGFILKEETIVERPDGTQHRRPRRVRPEDQPAKIHGPLQLEDEIPSAEDMMLQAIKVREETVGKASRDLVRNILKECAAPEVILKGEYSHCVEEDADISGEVLSLAIKELRDRGYKPSKEPEPGKGTWIHIKWPTKKKKSRRKKRSESTSPSEPQVQVKVKKKQTSHDEETRQKQTAAAKHRRQAMKERSDLPK